VIALRINPRLGNYARQMRREPTPFEDLLWRELRASRLEGFKFRRQAVVCHYTCDFFCPSLGLVIEIDGDTHDPDADARRDAAIQGAGFSVLRFTNSDVGNNLSGVLEAILPKARNMPPRFTHSPTLSLEREKEL